MKTIQELVKETQPFAEEDIKKSWWHLGSTTLIWGALLLLAAVDISLWIRIPASILAGLVTVRIFIIYHDYMHGALFKKSRWAKPIMRVYGVLVLNPPNIWNRTHNYHHAHNAQMATASIGSFPIMTTHEYAASGFWRRLHYRISRSCIPFFLGHVVIFLFGMCFNSFRKDPRKHWDSLLAAVVHFALIAGLATFGWKTLVLAYLFPLYLACMVGAYLFFIQHNFPDIKLKPRTEWTYLFAALKSSSYMEGSPLTHWFTGNIGYHHVHHLNARIPFYRLPEAMASIKELQNPGRTSLRPKDIASCMRCKLWDPELDRMVSFSEAERLGHLQLQTA